MSEFNFSEGWHGWERDPSTRTSVHAFTKYYPFRAATSTTASTLLTSRLTSVAETTLKLRSDEVKSKNLRDQVIKNSPKENEDYFVVPKVIE